MYHRGEKQKQETKKGQRETAGAARAEKSGVSASFWELETVLKRLEAQLDTGFSFFSLPPPLPFPRDSVIVIRACFRGWSVVVEMFLVSHAASCREFKEQGAGGRLLGLLRDLKGLGLRCVMCVCVCVCVCVVCECECGGEGRGIPRGGGRGGQCEEAGYEEYNGLRQTKKVIRILWDYMDCMHCRCVCVCMNSKCTCVNYCVFF